jgi:hypothetical protein
MTAPNIQEMRRVLMETLQDLRSREHPMEPDRARAISQIASVMVESAKVEVEFLKITQQDDSAFFSTSNDASDSSTRQIPSGTLQRIPGGVQHKMGR